MEQTWGDGQGGLAAPAPAGDVGGDAAVAAGVGLLHAQDLQDAAGQDRDSGRERTGSQAQNEAGSRVRT